MHSQVCIEVDPEKRPRAQELLWHPFFFCARVCWCAALGVMVGVMVGVGGGEVGGISKEVSDMITCKCILLM